jgi:lysophospholipase L1-like esterase
LPEDVAKRVSEGVYRLHANTAGGRVRFKTDSPYVAINVKMGSIGKMPHFAITGSAGFDLYTDNSYFATFVPLFDMADGYESVIELRDRKMREITINFPLYSDVCSIYIGLANDALVLPPAPYVKEKPVVYYGSSITQGGCASRPGMSYQGVISRRFNADYINLGFSGSARGEDVMADYINGLDMSVFVYDYDYNAPSVEHYEKTHERFFKKIREAHPDLPIVIMTRPKHKKLLQPVEYERLDIAKRTYENALAAGDENVYFIDGKELMELAGNDGTIDNTHPSDLGFYSMATRIYPLLKEILEKEA